MPIFDTHAHYDADQFASDREAVLTALPAAGVGLVVDPGCDVASSREAVALAERFDHVYAAVGIHPEDCDGCTDADFDAIRELCRREKIDFVLAVGGGSVIDTAKAIAIGVPYDGDFWDFFSGKMPEQALPVGTVLTIAASGSEGSPDSIITNEKTLEKNGAEADCLRPCFSVLDPALTESLPAYQTACGITDIMAHTFERYFTNTPDVEVTDRMLEGVLLAMLHEGRRVMEDPHNYEARANIMWAGMVCHNDIMGVGRQQDWNSHHLEHVLSAKYDCAHGAGLAVIMPAWMHYCAEHGGEKRLAQMAVRVFGCQMDFDDPKRTALEGIEAFRAFLRSIGMPLTFAEIGADPADIPELVEMNHIGDGKTGGYIGLDKQAHFDIYNLAAGSCVPET